jgi:hypothetical protein
VSATQGAWTCRHGVDGRDRCDECHAADDLLKQAVDLLTPGVYLDKSWDDDEWDLRRLAVLRTAGRGDVAEKIRSDRVEFLTAIGKPERAAKFAALAAQPGEGEGA